MENTAQQQAEAFWNTLEDRIKDAIDNPWLFRALIADGVIALKPMLESNFDGTEKVIGLLSDFCQVVFKGIEHPFVPFQAELMGKEFEFGSPSYWTHPTPEFFLTAYMIAILDRDKRNIEWLPKFIPKLNPSNASHKAPVFTQMAKFYAALYNPDPIWDIYQETLIATDPETNPGVPKELLDLLLAQLALYDGGFTNKPMLIQTQLPQVLAHTKQFWDQQSGAWPYEFRPDILPILAATVYARGSLGLKFMTDSVYLPSWLVAR